MALSEEEQQLLAQMEAALAEDDPQLAHTLRGRPTVAVDRRKALLAAFGVLAGLVLLVVGMITHWSLSLLGFAVMLAGALVGTTAWHRLEGGDEDQPPVTHAYSAPRPRTSFMDRMEEQWRRRMEEEGRG